MISYSVLNTVKEYLVTSGLGNYSRTDPWDIQVTPDEKPYPSAGESSVTLYPRRLSRSPLQGEQPTFDFEFELCCTKRVTKLPYDRQSKILFSDLITSLTSFTEMVGFILDTNTTIYNNIYNNIYSNKNTVVDRMDTIVSTTSEGISDSIATHLNGLQVLGTPRVAELIIKPIPRFDDFFTAYSTSRNTPEIPTIVSGYSTKIVVTGLQIILPNWC